MIAIGAEEEAEGAAPVTAASLRAAAASREEPSELCAPWDYCWPGDVVEPPDPRYVPIGEQFTIKLLESPYVDRSAVGDMRLCSSGFGQGVLWDSTHVVAHGLTDSSPIPNSLRQFLEDIGPALEDYVWIGYSEDNLIAFTRTPHGPGERFLALSVWADAWDDPDDEEELRWRALLWQRLSVC